MSISRQNISRFDALTQRIMVAEFIARQHSTGSPVNGETPNQNHTTSNMPDTLGSTNNTTTMNSNKYSLPPVSPSLSVSGGNSNSGHNNFMLQEPLSPQSMDMDGNYSASSYELGLKRKELFTQRKQREFIPDNKKDDSYWDRRRRNNEAAKRSREKRRYNDMVLEQRVVELTKENHVLKAQLDAIKDKFNITGENLVSVDQIMATLPTTEQVLSITKRAKLSSTVPPTIVYPPHAASPVQASVIHQTMNCIDGMPPSTSPSMHLHYPQSKANGFNNIPHSSSAAGQQQIQQNSSRTSPSTAVQTHHSNVIHPQQQQTTDLQHVYHRSCQSLSPHNNSSHNSHHSLQESQQQQQHNILQQAPQSHKQQHHRNSSLVSPVSSTSSSGGELDEQKYHGYTNSTNSSGTNSDNDCGNTLDPTQHHYHQMHQTNNIPQIYKHFPAHHHHPQHRSPLQMANNSNPAPALCRSGVPIDDLDKIRSVVAVIGNGNGDSQNSPPSSSTTSQQQPLKSFQIHQNSQHQNQLTSSTSSSQHQYQLCQQTATSYNNHNLPLSQYTTTHLSFTNSPTSAAAAAAVAAVIGSTSNGVSNQSRPDSNTPSAALALAANISYNASAVFSTKEQPSSSTKATTDTYNELAGNVLNLSRRASSPFELSCSLSASGALSGDDEQGDAQHPADLNNSLPLKLRHKSHLGDKDAASALLALQHIKQEPNSRASPPWDGEGSSDERDSGISIGGTEWTAQLQHNIIVPIATAENQEGNILKSQIARLESEVANIKNMMILSSTGPCATATAQ
ncbi:G-box-binding factor isoform X2 [Episyrphus balteatus]|uniref:G-box-binding factor isoform X2 n=1 Tax=Episyrphus balteatus TaxID=286459 RepID=UPI002484F2DD|nr:G-box-binding factor isoform X2 [Episyrphus balteatus]